MDRYFRPSALASGPMRTAGSAAARCPKASLFAPAEDVHQTEERLFRAT